MIVTIEVPCKVKSEANTRCHWAVRRRRFKEQREAVRLAWANQCNKRIWSLRPLVITMTHRGRKMDSDNLAGAFKAVRDEIAAIIGRDDGDESIEWRYRQEKGKGSITVTIEGKP